MKTSELLQKIEIALKARNPLLVNEYLRPGLSERMIDRLLKPVSGKLEPLYDIYSWHDGTKFVHLSAGETFAAGMKKIGFFPEPSFHFIDLRLAVLSINSLAQKAKLRPVWKEGEVGNWLPFFYNGATAHFYLDLAPDKNSRVMFFDSQDGKLAREAYPALEAFLRDILRANESGQPLRFLAG